MIYKLDLSQLPKITFDGIIINTNDPYSISSECSHLERFAFEISVH